MFLHIINVILTILMFDDDFDPETSHETITNHKNSSRKFQKNTEIIEHL